MSFLDATGLGTFWGKLKNYFVSKDNFYTDIPDGLCHNSIYREKDITADYLNGTVSTNIANGTFHDIFPGDRITLNNHNYIVGGLDYYKNRGPANMVLTSQHHLLMILNDGTLGTAKMNSTATTTGGYKGSEMYTALARTDSGSYYATISGDFGASHMVKFPARLTTRVVNVQGAMVYNETNPGRTNFWEWSLENLVLMTEVQIRGTIVASSSFFDIGEGYTQIPVFALNATLQYMRAWPAWLRGVADGNRFCILGALDDNYCGGATLGYLVRPIFCIK